MKEFCKIIFYGYKIHGGLFLFATFWAIVFNAKLQQIQSQHCK